MWLSLIGIAVGIIIVLALAELAVEGLIALIRERRDKDEERPAFPVVPRNPRKRGPRGSSN